MHKGFKILLFVLFPLILFMIFELAARQIFLSHSDMTIKFRDFNLVKDKVELLFVGNSHIEKGVNPDFMDCPAFNLAYSAQDLYYNYKILKKYLPEMDSLKTLVIGIDPFAFFYDESINSMYFVKDYFFYEKILPQNGFSFQFMLNTSVFWLNRGKFFVKLLNRDLQKKDYPYLKSYNRLFNYLAGQYLVSNGQRLAVGNMSLQNLENDARNTIKRIVNNSDSDMLIKNKRYLEKIIRMANKRNISVLVVYAPVSSYYVKRIPEKYAKSATQALQMLKFDKQLKFQFYDFSLLYKNTPDYFFNSDHLNREGSEAFSLVIKSLLK